MTLAALPALPVALTAAADAADAAADAADAAADAARAARTAGWGAHSPRISIDHIWRSVWSDSEAEMPGWIVRVGSERIFFHTAPFPGEVPIEEIHRMIEKSLGCEPLPWRKKKGGRSPHQWEVR